MFNTFNFMAFNWCCILGGPYYPTLPYNKNVHSAGWDVAAQWAKLKVAYY